MAQQNISTMFDDYIALHARWEETYKQMDNLKAEVEDSQGIPSTAVRVLCPAFTGAASPAAYAYKLECIDSLYSARKKSIETLWGQTHPLDIAASKRGLDAEAEMLKQKLSQLLQQQQEVYDKVGITALSAQVDEIEEKQCQLSDAIRDSRPETFADVQAKARFFLFSKEVDEGSDLETFLNQIASLKQLG